MRKYDLCVIGSGPAGQKGAIQAAKLGKQVCIVEERPVLGGNAVHTGTIPSKALREAILRTAGRTSAMPRIADFVAARGISFSDLLANCHAVVQVESEIVQRQCRSNGIDLLAGTGAFLDAHTLEVQGEYTRQTITADYFLIATGSRPTRPRGVPFDQCNIMTSDELLGLPQLPHSLIVVGGGVIGTEYASMIAMLGVRVTLIDARPRILDFVDAEISEALQYHLRQAGVTLRLGEQVVKIARIDPPAGARSSDGVMVEVGLESGKTLRTDALLYCVGRQGNTEALNLPAVGLTADDRGRIKVGPAGQTTVPHVYAAGDVIGFPALASTSMEQGRAAVCAMFAEPYDGAPELLPYGIYSIPEISMVGMTEERLTKEGVPYEAGIAQYKEIARGQLLGDEIGMLKLLIHQETHALLGVHVIGTGATELVHIGQVVMAFRGTAEYFVRTVLNYPTLAECYRVAALNGLNKLRHL
ncbi:MAG TPA: Si-specific NAD(P)(+) transhydrogenase [Polyangia bacterium]|jgi:NAD(P) transhydrogenase|nr:Si-specific NAD(P)(+) transhydrogenase [Polyangia bacterium]